MVLVGSRVGSKHEPRLGRFPCYKAEPSCFTVEASGILRLALEPLIASGCSSKTSQAGFQNGALTLCSYPGSCRG